jgi:uncharacterized protein YutE (UPF0331/DUF86 family)
MSRERAALLEATLKKRLVDARRHLAALEHAATEFGGDFDLDSFEAAWRSDDPVELTRAYAVQAGYENVINACITIAQELAELEGWSVQGVQPSSVEALRLLHQNGVVTGTTRRALANAQERRSDIQHDYVNVGARELHAAANELIEHAPLMLQDVAGVLRSRS